MISMKVSRVKTRKFIKTVDVMITSKIQRVKTRAESQFLDMIAIKYSPINLEEGC